MRVGRVGRLWATKLGSVSKRMVPRGLRACAWLCSARGGGGVSGVAALLARRFGGGETGDGRGGC